MAVALPRSLVWEVTAKCNLRCSHCYNVWTAEGQPIPSELTTNECLRISQRIRQARWPLEALTLTGGEPLLRADLNRLVSTLRQANEHLPINVATNGLVLDLERAQSLRDAGTSAVQLTLLSASPGQHDAMVGRPGAFLSVLRAISLSKRVGLACAVFFVAMRENIRSFAGAAKLAISIGADAIVLNRFQPGGRGLVEWKRRTPSPEQLQEAIAVLPELRRWVPASLGTIIPPCEGMVGDEASMRCPVGTEKAYPAIGPDGTMRPCNHWPGAVGSVVATPLESLLMEPGMTLPADRPSNCQTCEHWARCGGGCPGAQRLAGGFIYRCR